MRLYPASYDSCSITILKWILAIVLRLVDRKLCSKLVILRASQILIYLSFLRRLSVVGKPVCSSSAHALWTVLRYLIWSIMTNSCILWIEWSFPLINSNFLTDILASSSGFFSSLASSSCVLIRSSPLCYLRSLDGVDWPSVDMIVQIDDILSLIRVELHELLLFCILMAEHLFNFVD